jgi:signal transduction histidine kinase
MTKRVRASHAPARSNGSGAIRVVPPRTPSTRSLASLLARHRAEILERWAQRVREDPEVPEANRLPTPALQDHIPALLDEIVATVDRGHGAAKDAEAAHRFGKILLPKEHARHRLRSGYTLEAALRELSLFRSTVLDFLYLDAKERGSLDLTGMRLLHGAIDDSMAVSAAEMQRQSQAALAVERDLRERFMAVVAHDLRSPLSNVVMAAELLLKLEPDEHQTRLLERILRGAHRIGRMIDDLLDFAEARSGQIRMHTAAGDLGEIVRDIVETFREQHPERTVAFSAHGDARGAWDADRVSQMLTNLLTNAVTHGSSHTPVRVDVRGEGRAQAVVEVHNEGHPIPPEELALIFEPFRRGMVGAHPKRGLGLGLYIAREIARAHGGSLDVRSHEGAGTTFLVRLARTL